MADQGSQNEFLLEVKNLKKHFPIRRGVLRRVVGSTKAVDGIDFYIRDGETLGLVGESGCGKTTTGRTILRAIEPTSGEVRLKDPLLGWVDVVNLDDKQLKQVRRNVRLVFQDPYASLNPRMTLLEIVGAPLYAMGLASGQALQDRVAELLRMVGLPPEYMRRYPHAFSGGQRQRIGLARALAPNPRLVIADEPVSALDVSVQAQILNLLRRLQSELGLTYLFITHDLSVIGYVSDRVAVMYVGKLVEMAGTEVLFRNPLHPYTEALMSAVPKPDPRAYRDRFVLPGEVADPSNPPSGCYFHPRCLYAQQVCQVQEPSLEEVAEGHFVSCHRAAELTLRGVLD